MRSFLARPWLVGMFVVLVSIAHAGAQTPSQTPFAGRWEITVQPAAGDSPLAGSNKVALFILDITPSGPGESARRCRFS